MENLSARHRLKQGLSPPNYVVRIAQHVTEKGGKKESIEDRITLDQSVSIRSF